MMANLEQDKPILDIRNRWKMELKVRQMYSTATKTITLPDFKTQANCVPEGGCRVGAEELLVSTPHWPGWVVETG